MRIRTSFFVVLLFVPVLARSSHYVLLGPMLGHTTSTNARIWVRASEPARVSLRISSDPELSRGRLIHASRLTTNTANAGEILISGLRPNTQYYYSVLLNGKPALNPPYPAFTTPLPEGADARVRFAFTSCVGFKGYDSAAGYADMATRTNIDLLFMLGDNHYANTNDLAKQRLFYADQRRQSGWRDLTSRMPTYALWDDHDYGPDNSDGTMKGKEVSLRAFREHWANPYYGETNNPGVYSRFSRANVDFFLLDVRYHRSPNKATNLVKKTMLGPAQLQWLKRELLTSTAPVKVIMSGSEFQSNGTVDSWASFKQERDELLDFIKDAEISGVLLVSGDRHFTAAYQVRTNWIEVTAGPIGSGNADAKNVGEMFLNYSPTKSKFYCIYDIDTRVRPPSVTLEVYRVAEGLAQRRVFTWDEVIGKTKIKTLPVPAKKEPEKQRDRPSESH
jgi:alkaline phosphatase D